MKSNKQKKTQTLALKPIYFLILLSILFASSCKKAIFKKIQKDIDLKAIAYLNGKSDGEFIGLDSIINSLESDTTDVLLIHGVRSQKSNHFNAFIQALTLDLGFEDAPLLDTFELESENVSMYGNSKVYYFLYEKENGKILRFFNVHWSPITDLVKKAIYTNLDKDEDRTKLAKQIKNKFMIDVFTDLTLYLGNYKSLIQKPVQLALDSMLVNTNSNKVFITGSFGSKVVFDVLKKRQHTVDFLIQSFREMHKDIKSIDDTSEFWTNKDAFFSRKFKTISRKIKSKHIANGLQKYELDTAFIKKTFKSAKGMFLEKKELRECVAVADHCDQMFTEKMKSELLFSGKIKGFFMLSNQLPFTSLLELSPQMARDSLAFVNNIYQELNSYFDETREQLDRTNVFPDKKIQNDVIENLDKIKIISFYDPNDIFGYRLPPLPSASLEVVNVEINNTIPFYFDPLALKNKYLSNPKSNGMVNSIRNTLRLDLPQQSLVVDIDEPNESAKNNRIILKYLVEGGHANEKTDSLIITKRFPRKSTDALKLKTGKKKFDAGHKKKGTISYRYHRKQPIRDFFGDKIINSFVKKIEKLEIKKAHLNHELPTSDIDFEGLNLCFEKNDTVNILTMHGMVSKSPEHFDLMIHKIVNKLNFNENPIRETVSSPIEVNEKEIRGSFQIKIQAYQNYKKQILQVFIVYWSPVTFPAKNILKDIDGQNNMKDKRAAIPAKVKDMLINDGFCDVSLSLKTFRPVIDSCLSFAFSHLLAKDPFTTYEKLEIDSLNKKRNTFFISGSLGSKLLFDYISTSLSQDRSDPNQQHLFSVVRLRNTKQLIKDRLHTFFMLSNQLSLISVRDLNPSVTRRGQNALLKEINKNVYNDWENAIEDSIKIVAFYDPNDVLGFKLMESESPKLDIQNVVLNLADGYDMNVKDLIKLIIKIDKVLFESIPKDKNEKGRDKDLKRKKKLRKKLNLSLLANIQPYLDSDNARQTFVFDFLKAHQGGSEDERVIEMIVFGTDRINQLRKTKKLVSKESLAMGKK